MVDVNRISIDDAAVVDSTQENGGVKTGWKSLQ
jgi:hypothetical protein